MNKWSIDKILNVVRQKIEKSSDLLYLTTGIEFEEAVGEILEIMSKENPGFQFENNGKHSFPDYNIYIDEKVYGLEIKYSNRGAWRSPGNSVFETISNKKSEVDDGYQEIYLLFGRKPKKNEEINHVEVKYSKYEEAISDVQVTHSPRYSINMDDSTEEKFFPVIETTYKEFRFLSTQEKNQLLRLYFTERKSSEDKWYIPLNIEEESTEILPTMFEHLDKKQQEKLKSEAMILYPTDLFSGYNANYKNITEYFVTEYFVISSSLRDIFSAGGRKKVKSLHKELKYPQLLFQYESMQETIQSIINNPSDEFIENAIEIWSENNQLIKVDETIPFGQLYKEIISNYKFLVTANDGRKNVEIEKEFLWEIYSFNKDKFE